MDNNSAQRLADLLIWFYKIPLTNTTNISNEWKTIALLFVGCDARRSKSNKKKTEHRQHQSHSRIIFIFFFLIASIFFFILFSKLDVVLCFCVVCVCRLHEWVKKDENNWKRRALRLCCSHLCCCILVKLSLWTKFLLTAFFLTFVHIHLVCCHNVGCCRCICFVVCYYCCCCRSLAVLLLMVYLPRAHIKIISNLLFFLCFILCLHVYMVKHEEKEEVKKNRSMFHFSLTNNKNES